MCERLGCKSLETNLKPLNYNLIYTKPNKVVVKLLCTSCYNDMQERLINLEYQYQYDLINGKDEEIMKQKDSKLYHDNSLNDLFHNIRDWDESYEIVHGMVGNR